MSAQRTGLIWDSDVDPYDKLILLALEECSGGGGVNSYWSGDVDRLAKFIGMNPHMLTIFHLDRFKRAGVLTRQGVPSWAGDAWRFDLTPILDYDPYAEYEAERSDAIPARKSQREKVRGYVYLLEGEDGKYYKIGKSKHPRKRAEMLAIQLPFRVQLIHTIEADDYDQAERDLHEKYRSLRMNGEWFELPPCEVEQICHINEYEDGDFV